FPLKTLRLTVRNVSRFRAAKIGANHGDQSAACGVFSAPKTYREAAALATRHTMGPDCSLQGQASPLPCRAHASRRKQGSWRHCQVVGDNVVTRQQQAL